MKWTCGSCRETLTRVDRMKRGRQLAASLETGRFELLVAGDGRSHAPDAIESAHKSLSNTRKSMLFSRYFLRATFEPFSENFDGQNGQTWEETKNRMSSMQ